MWESLVLPTQPAGGREHGGAVGGSTLAPYTAWRSETPGAPPWCPPPWLVYSSLALGRYLVTFVKEPCKFQVLPEAL